MDIHDIYQTRLRYYQAYQQFLSITRIPLPTTTIKSTEPHECTCECIFFIVEPDLYFCRHSGNGHICNAYTCEKRLVDSDREVCPITGLCYPLELTDDIYGDRIDRGQHESLWDGIEDMLMTIDDDMYEDPIISIPMISTTDTLDTSITNIPISPCLDSTLTTITSNTTMKRKQRTARSSHIEDYAISQEQMNIYRKQIQAVIGLTKQTLPDDEIEYLVQLTDQLWRLLVKSTHFQHNRFSYRENYHVLVVLSNCISGFRVKDLELIPTRPEIRKVLPPLKTIKKLPGILVPWLTRHEKFFRQAIGSCTQDNLEQFKRSINRSKLYSSNHHHHHHHA